MRTKTHTASDRALQVALSCPCPVYSYKLVIVIIVIIKHLAFIMCWTGSECSCPTLWKPHSKSVK